VSFWGHAPMLRRKKKGSAAASWHRSTEHSTEEKMGGRGRSVNEDAGPGRKRKKKVDDVAKKKAHSSRDCLVG